jgi:hypothetical protein
MPEYPQQGRGKVPLNQFLADLKSTLTDQELREKYQLSALDFVGLIKSLLAKCIITPQDLVDRRESAVQRDLQKESQFLQGLYLCPACSHPSPARFDRCPACGASPADFETAGHMDSVTESGHHFYFETDPKEDFPQDADLTEAPTEPLSEAPTERLAEVPTERLAEVPTEPMSDAPTERLDGGGEVATVEIVEDSPGSVVAGDLSFAEVIALEEDSDDDLIDLSAEDGDYAEDFPPTELISLEEQERLHQEAEAKKKGSQSRLGSFFSKFIKK